MALSGGRPPQASPAAAWQPEGMAANGAASATIACPVPTKRYQHASRIDIDMDADIDAAAGEEIERKRERARRSLPVRSLLFSRVF